MTPVAQPTPTYYVRPHELHTKTGKCDCTLPCIEVVKVNSFDALTEANENLVAMLTAATVMLEAIEAHCVNERGLRGIDHAEDGRRGRAAMQAMIPNLRATLKGAA